MRQMVFVALMAVAAVGCAGDPAERNVPLAYSIADAMAKPEYKDRFSDVKFYFGNQPHPAVERTIRTVTTSQKSNAVGHSKIDSCDRAFASALLRLRAGALRLGGDAVVNIKSNYDHREVSSEAQFQCATGAIMSGVALKGEVVKLR